MEARRHFSVTYGPVATVNAGRTPGHQSEASIGVDPTNPSRVFAASNYNRSSLLAYASTDGGATWAVREVGTEVDGLPHACCDPTVAFDRFGNLYLGYVNVDTGATEVILSVDGGLTFRPLATLKGTPTSRRSRWETTRSGSRTNSRTARRRGARPCGGRARCGSSAGPARSRARRGRTWGTSPSARAGR